MTAPFRIPPGYETIFDTPGTAPLSDTELLEELDWDYEVPCQATKHSDGHQKRCGQPATWYFTCWDITCHAYRWGFLCDDCMPYIWDAAQYGLWCCTHQDCQMTDLNARFLGK